MPEDGACKGLDFVTIADGMLQGNVQDLQSILWQIGPFLSPAKQSHGGLMTAI